MSEKMIKKVKYEEPLSQKIESAQKSLEIPVSKLRSIDEKLQTRDNMLRAKVVEAMRDRNESYAKMCAAELACVRNVRTMMGNTRMALEQLQLRLNTVSDLGDIMVTLNPCMAIIKDLGPSIEGLMPQASDSMNGLAEILGDVMGKSNLNVKEAEASMNEDAMAIYQEVGKSLEREQAEFIPKIPNMPVEQPLDAKQRIPEIPPDLNKPSEKQPLPEVPRYLKEVLEELS